MILLDACYNVPPEDTVCPVDVFHQDDNIRNLRKHLSENGTLTINVVLIGDKDDFLKDVGVQKSH